MDASSEVKPPVDWVSGTGGKATEKVSQDGGGKSQVKTEAVLKDGLSSHLVSNAWYLVASGRKNECYFNRTLVRVPSIPHGVHGYFRCASPCIALFYGLPHFWSVTRVNHQCISLTMKAIDSRHGE